MGTQTLHCPANDHGNASHPLTTRQVPAHRLKPQVRDPQSSALTATPQHMGSHRPRFSDEETEAQNHAATFPRPRGSVVVQMPQRSPRKGCSPHPSDSRAWPRPTRLSRAGGWAGGLHLDPNTVAQRQGALWSQSPESPHSTSGAQLQVIGCRPASPRVLETGKSRCGEAQKGWTASARLPSAPLPGPPPPVGPAYLDAVLLQVQVPCVDRDAGWDLGQVSPCADHPAGLVAAGAGRGAGGGRWGAPSGSRRHGHSTSTGPQGWGEEPEEEQCPVGPGHPTRRQRGARGAAGTRHPQCSCSAWTLGGCGWGKREGRGSVRDRSPRGPGACQHPGSPIAASLSHAQNQRGREGDSRQWTHPAGWGRQREAWPAQPSTSSSSPCWQDSTPILQRGKLRLGERKCPSKVTQPVSAEVVQIQNPALCMISKR